MPPGLVAAFLAELEERVADVPERYRWDYTEALLTVAANALSKTTTTGCNAGFLRTEALLHVILVSDEPEQSPHSWSSCRKC